MAFRFNPFTGKLDFDTTNDGLASSYASQAATSSTNAATALANATVQADNAATSASNAALSETNAAAFSNAAELNADLANGLNFKVNATAFNINNNNDLGGLTSSAAFADEGTDVMLSMALGSAQYDYTALP